MGTVSLSLYGSLAPKKWYYIYKITAETGFEDILLTATLRHKPGEGCPPGLSYQGAFLTDGDGRIIPFKQVGDEFTY